MKLALPRICPCKCIYLDANRLGGLTRAREADRRVGPGPRQGGAPFPWQQTKVARTPEPVNRKPTWKPFILPVIVLAWLAGPMSSDRFMKELDDRALLEAQALDHRGNPLHEAAARGTVATERTPPPQHRAPLHALGMIVGRLDPLDDDKGPQRRLDRQQARAQAPGPGIAAALAVGQNPQQFQRQRRHLLIQACSGAATASEQSGSAREELHPCNPLPPRRRPQWNRTLTP